jgi:hypothetical protein
MAANDANDQPRRVPRNFHIDEEIHILPGRAIRRCCVVGIVTV